MIKPKVLFLYSDNCCRTQMAEAFLRARDDIRRHVREFMEQNA